MLQCNKCKIKWKNASADSEGIVILSQGDIYHWPDGYKNLCEKCYKELME